MFLRRNMKTHEEIYSGELKALFERLSPDTRANFLAPDQRTPLEKLNQIIRDIKDMIELMDTHLAHLVVDTRGELESYCRVLQNRASEGHLDDRDAQGNLEHGFYALLLRHAELRRINFAAGWLRAMRGEVARLTHLEQMGQQRTLSPDELKEQQSVKALLRILEAYFKSDLVACTPGGLNLASEKSPLRRL
jgi:hypothetical protein